MGGPVGGPVPSLGQVFITSDSLRNHPDFCELLLGQDLPGPQIHVLPICVEAQGWLSYVCVTGSWVS